MFKLGHTFVCSSLIWCCVANLFFLDYMCYFVSFLVIAVPVSVPSLVLAAFSWLIMWISSFSSSYKLSVYWNITEIRYVHLFRFVTVLHTGSRSSGGNNSKKTSSSSSSTSRKTTSSSSHKAPSGNSKKKSARSKAKERTLRRYMWAYVGILFAMIIVPLVVRSRLIVQTVSASSMWIGLYWFSTVVDHIVITSHKWLPCIVTYLYQRLQWHFYCHVVLVLLLGDFFLLCAFEYFGLLLIVMVTCRTLFANLMSVALWLQQDVGNWIF